MPVSLCKIGKFLLPAIFSLIFLAPQALACFCFPINSPKKELEQASFVFSGKVVNTDASYWLRINHEFPFIHFIVWDTYLVFSVKEVWKGAVTPEIRIMYSLKSCSFRFKEGEEYIVYAGGNDLGGISTGICSRTARLIDANEDLTQLGIGRHPELPSMKSSLPAIGSLLLALALPLLIMRIYCLNRGGERRE